MERAEDLGRSRGGGFSVDYTGVCMLLSGLSIGALLMYLFDPDRGRTRRSQLSDQVTSKFTHLEEAVEGRARDLGNRAKGVLHEVKVKFPGSASRTTNEGEQLAEPLA